MFNFSEKYAAKLSLKFKKALQLLEDRVHRNHENLGLSIDQFEKLIRTIISKTTSLSRSILNLPDSYGCQLMQSLVPKETVPSELILELAMKILTSFRDNKKLIEQTLRWLNCILQYSACQTDEMEVLYELLLPLLQRQSLVSFFYYFLSINNTNLLPFSDIFGNRFTFEDYFEQKIYHHKAKSKNIARS